MAICTEFRVTTCNFNIHMQALMRTGENMIFTHCNTNIPTALKKVYIFLFYLKIKKNRNIFEEPRREFKRVRFPRF